MDINRKNYHSFVLDHLDGSLSADQEKALWLFLENNPDIREEVIGLEGASLKGAPATMPSHDKAALQGLGLEHCPGDSITEDNCHAWFIASVEGTLLPEQQEGLNAFLRRHPNMKREYALYGKTRLSPPHHISYPHKRTLKRVVVPVYVRRMVYYGAAAAIAFLLAMVWHPAFFRAELPQGPTLVSLDRQPITLAQTPYSPTEDDSRAKDDKQQPVTTEYLKEQATTHQHREKHKSQPSRSTTAKVPPVLDKQNVSPVKVNITPELALQYRPVFSHDAIADRKTQRPGFSDHVFMGLRQMENYQDLGFIAWGAFEDLTGVEREMNFDHQGKNLLWTIADLGIAGINAITGKDMELNRKVDQEGRLAEYRLKTSRMQIKTGR